MYDEFTVNKNIPIFAQFIDEAYLGGYARNKVWSTDVVLDLREKVRERAEHLTYSNAPLYEVLEKRGYLIQNKSGLVIGSESPWLEAMLIEFGAKHVTTLEYGKIISLDSQIDTYTPTEFIHGFLRGEIPQFDFAFTYSSIEHDGLGRYGDVLNPNGDLQTMARVMNFVKPGGFVFVGVPCCHDLLVWNAHRIYGPIRLPKLFAGYKVLGVYPENSRISHQNHGNLGYQPVWVLQNRYGCEEFPRRKGPQLTNFGET